MAKMTGTDMASAILAAMGIDESDTKNEMAVEKWEQACTGLISYLVDNMVIKVPGVETGDNTVEGTIDND